MIHQKFGYNPENDIVLHWCFLLCIRLRLGAWWPKEEKWANYSYLRTICVDLSISGVRHLFIYAKTICGATQGTRGILNAAVSHIFSNTNIVTAK